MPHVIEQRAAGGVAADDTGGAGDRDDNADPLKITAAELETMKALQDVLDYLKEKGERIYPTPQKITVNEKRENSKRPDGWKNGLKHQRNIEKNRRQRGRTNTRLEGLQQVADMLAAEAAAAEG